MSIMMPLFYLNHPITRMVQMNYAYRIYHNGINLGISTEAILIKQLITIEETKILTDMQQGWTFAPNY